MPAFYRRIIPTSWCKKRCELLKNRLFSGINEELIAFHKIPVIPEFENKSALKGSTTEGASTSASMEGATAEPQVYTNGTDALDVGEHDDIFENGSAENTQTDDEFESNERMMEEEEAEHGHTKKDFIEVEDIFENDNQVISTADIDDGEMRKVNEDMEDIFGEDNSNVVEEEEHDYEPIFTAGASKAEPIIKITDADAERSESAIDAEVNGDHKVEVELDAELPFPDMPRKSDISLNWEEVVEDEQPKEHPTSLTHPTADTDPSPLVNIDTPCSPPSINIDPTPATTSTDIDVPQTDIEFSPTSVCEKEAEHEDEQMIDEGEVAKFVENILISSMNEVSSQAEDQETENQIENVVEVEVNEPIFDTPETTVESDNAPQVLSPLKVDAGFVSEPSEKEDNSVSVNVSASDSADINGLDISNERELKIHTSLPINEVKDEKSVDVVKNQNVDVKESPEVEVPTSNRRLKERSITLDSALLLENTPASEAGRNMESSDGRTRKMSVPKPRDVRKDLSDSRPSFFGSSASGPKPFMSNTLPRVSVLPRISTSYQRKSPTSPASLSGDFSSSFDKDSEELPTVARPDLTKEDTQVLNELDTIELPLVESLSNPASPRATIAPNIDVDPIVPVKETKVESGAMAPVYASKGAGKAPIVLDGTSPEEIEAIFAKDPEEEPKKKSMGKEDVIASTRVRKISRTTWKGQEEFQKSVDKAAVVLDEPQAASLKRYQERKKQKYDAFAGKYRTREDSTSEAESESSQSSQTGPKMPDVVQSGGSKSSKGNANTEIVAPKLNMKSVRSLWEQKAAEVEQRRRSLQTKSRPVSQGERYRPSKSFNKSCDGLDNLDDSIEGSTTYSCDGSDDGSSKRESLIERDIRLQKERNLEISKDRDRLRSESTSSRDESQQSETSETQDDQVIDIVRDTELRRDSDDGRSSPSQSSGYTSGRSTPSTPAGDGKSSGKMPELKMSLSPTDPDASSNYKEYQKALKGNKTDKFSKSATFPRRMENFDKPDPNIPIWKNMKLKSIYPTKSKTESSSISPTNSVGDVPDVIMVDGNKAKSPTTEKARKSSIVQQGIKLSQKLEQKKIAKLEKKPRRSLMEIEIAAQREKEEAFRREQKTRKMSTSKSVGDEAQPESSTPSSTTSSPSTTPQSSPRKTSISGATAKSVYKDLNYAPQTNKKKLALAGHWEHKWK